MSEEIAKAIDDAFTTKYGTLIDAVVDSFQHGGLDGNQNLIEVIDALSQHTKQIAESITPQAMPGHDATGGTVTSLTEAVMGVTGGLVQIAAAINALAEAVSEKTA